jgi:diguanylate cyclase (GGDEF)-like protein
VGVLVAASDSNRVPLTVALIDIDNFKTINDSFSHMVGDMVLKRVAAIIGEHCRANDLPVRYGGDEFLLVLAGADREGSARVLRRLKDAVDACSWSADSAGPRSGDAVHRRGDARAGEPIATTIADADQALYTAKSGGRNRIVYCERDADRRTSRDPSGRARLRHRVCRPRNRWKSCPATRSAAIARRVAPGIDGRTAGRVPDGRLPPIRSRH